MASSWPEVIKSKPSSAHTVQCDYECRPSWGSGIIRGKTTVNTMQEGESNLVFCTRKTPYRPGKLKLTQFQARRQINSGTDGVIYYKPFSDPGSPYMKVSGHLASMFGSPVADATGFTIPSMDSALAEYCHMEARAKIHEGFGGDLGLMILEAKETFNFMRNPFKTLTKGFGAMARDVAKKRTPFKPELAQGRKAVDDWTSAWLEYRYALLPAMFDLEFITSDFLKKLRTTRIMRSYSRQTYGQKLTVSHGKYPLILVDMYFSRHVKEHISYSGVCHFMDQWNISDQAWLSGMVGFGGDNIANLIWEKIPLSFVVDWVIGVGDFLRAVRPEWYRRVVGGSVTMKMVTDTRTFFTAITPIGTPGVKLKVPASTHFSLTESVHRKPFTTLPTTPPLTRQALSVARKLDALSLAWKLFPAFLKRKPKT